MEKIKIMFLVLLAITVIFGVAVAYANVTASEENTADSEWKHPTDYGIMMHFYAKEVKQCPTQYYTPEELGIVLAETTYPDIYDIYIVDAEKALRWMSPDIGLLYIKYNDKFYSVEGVRVDNFGPPYPLDYLRRGPVVATISSALAGCWCFLGMLVWKRRGNNAIH